MIFIRFTCFLRFIVMEFQFASFILFLCFLSLIFIYFRDACKLTTFRSQIFKVLLLVLITQATKSLGTITNVISFHDLQVFLCKQIFYLTLIILHGSGYSVLKSFVLQWKIHCFWHFLFDGCFIRSSIIIDRLTSSIV